MSDQTTKLDVGAWIQETAPNVFETMLALTLVPANHGHADSEHERVCGTVGLGGENVTGAVYLHMAEPLAKKVTSAMLGMPVEEVNTDTDVNDVVGELCNMVAGGLKSTLCDLGSACAVSTPTIIRGRAFAVETTPDVPVHRLTFLCDTHSLLVEVHLKLN